MNIHKKHILMGFLASVMMILVFSIASAAPVTIDTMDDGGAPSGEARVCDDFDGCTITIPGVGTFPIPNASSSTVPVIGMERDLVVNHTNGNGEVNLRVNQNGSQSLSYSSDTGTTGTAQVVWDADSDPLVIDTTGLNNADLTDSGNNNGFQLIVLFADGDFNLTIRVINGATESSYILPLTDDVGPPGQSFFIPFSDFTGDLVSFSQVGAVVFDIAQQEPAVDLEIDLFEATSDTDWGDLPDSYNATLGTDSGANHVVGLLHLGDIIDREADGIESAVADGDNTQDLDDEDGIVIPTNANNFGDGSADILYTPNGITRGCLVGWIDWNDDGFFDATTSGTNNASELVMNISIPAASMGSQLTETITSPLYAAGGYEYPPELFARFRLFPPFDPLFGGNWDGTGCPDESGLGTALPTLVFGQAAEGEVEDYRISFSNPTAVNLQTFSADNNATTLPVVGIAIVAVLALVSAGIFIVRREQKQA